MARQRHVASADGFKLIDFTPEEEAARDAEEKILGRWCCN